MSFPILIIKEKDPNWYVYGSEFELKRTTRELLKQGAFDSCYTIDSQGKCHSIVQVKEIGFNGLIGGWHPFHKGTQIIVDFLFDYIGQKDLEAVKQIILPRVKHNINFWHPKGSYTEMVSIIEDITEFRKLFYYLQ